MSGWKPKRDRSRAVVSPVQADGYHVVCRCCGELSGRRLPRFQVLECPTCGTRLFVMPEDRYPATDPSMSDSSPVVVPVAHKPQSRKRRSRQPLAQGESDVPTAVLLSAADTRKEVDQKADRPVLTLSARGRLVTPLRMLIVLMVVIAAATGFAVYRRSEVQRAEREYREHADAGTAAMRDGDFPRAATEFELAVEAIDRLGRDDAPSRHIRQMARECRAAGDLMLQPLVELLEQAESFRNDPAAWDRHFQRQAAGKWIVLDTTVQKLSADDNAGRYRIDYPMQIGLRTVELDAALDIFERVPFDGSPQRIIFAAQLKSCRLTGGAEGRWLVQFHRSSAFLWTDDSNLRALGFGVAEPSHDGLPAESDIATERELKQRLDSQSRLMGVTE